MQKIFESIDNELKRQQNTIELIASENFVSEDILKVQGSILTNKYAEGYPSKRYYGGCKYIDEIEKTAIDLAKEVFSVKFANVQPHSGSGANMAAYRALIEPKDKVLGMQLESGGHLTHGHNMNFSGQDYNFVFYTVDEKTGQINYDKVREIANKEKPKLIVAGTSAYSRSIDFAEFKDIADECGAYLLVDMAHIAGLVAAGLHQNPCKYADIVTSTTHKTLRGPRGGLILTNNSAIAKKIDQKVFPGIQGGPLMHVIAAKAICFNEAKSKEFIEYQKQVINNCKVLCDVLKQEDFVIVGSGTDTHLLLVDVKASVNMTGKEAEALLEKINITCNKNTIPFDSTTPFITSGIRLGTAAMTTRGFKEKEFLEVGKIIVECLQNNKNNKKQESLKKRVKELVERFPIYENLSTENNLFLKKLEEFSKSI